MHPLDFLYLVCLMLGGLYTLFSLLMGGVSHAAGHIADHVHVPGLSDMMGHHDSAATDAPHGSAEHGHGDAPDHAHGRPGMEHAGDAVGLHLLAYLNPISLAGFLLGFGGIGMIARVLGVSPLLSAFYALSGGCGLWVLAYLFIFKFVGASQASSHYREDDVLGLRGQVTAPITGSQPGMVACVVAGRRQQFRAITEEEEPIPMGAAVRIRTIHNNTAKVIRIDSSIGP